MALPDPETLAREYHDGGTLAGLGERYGVSWQLVKRALEQQGVAIRQHGGRRGPEPPTADVLVAAYQDGFTVPEVAARHRVSHVRVADALREAGVPLRSRMRGPDGATLAAEYLAGASVEELAERYGLSSLTVRNRLKDADVQLRRRPQTRKPTKGTPTSVLAEGFRNGATLAELGRRYGLSGPAVGTRLKRAGITRTAPEPPH